MRRLTTANPFQLTAWIILMSVCSVILAIPGYAFTDVPRPAWVTFLGVGGYFGFWLSFSVGYIQAGLRQRRLGVRIDDFGGAIGDVYDSPHGSVTTGWMKSWWGKVGFGIALGILLVVFAAQNYS